MTRFTRQFRLLAGSAVFAVTLVGLGAGSAAAANGPEYVGACNMLHALDGNLYHAWVVESAHGWDGKWRAIAASDCPAQRFDQPVHQ